MIAGEDELKDSQVVLRDLQKKSQIKVQFEKEAFLKEFVLF